MGSLQGEDEPSCPPACLCCFRLHQANVFHASCFMLLGFGCNPGQRGGMGPCARSGISENKWGLEPKRARSLRRVAKNQAGSEPPANHRCCQRSRGPADCRSTALTSPFSNAAGFRVAGWKLRWPRLPVFGEKRQQQEEEQDSTRSSRERWCSLECIEDHLMHGLRRSYSFCIANKLGVEYNFRVAVFVLRAYIEV